VGDFFHEIQPKEIKDAKEGKLIEANICQLSVTQCGMKMVE